MRGLWTAGITDVMMEHNVWPDGLIGVSAGAAFGCNYKSRQIGRAIRYNTRFAKDSRYSGMKSLLLSGDYFNAKFGYHVVPYKYDKGGEGAGAQTTGRRRERLDSFAVFREHRIQA